MQRKQSEGPVFTTEWFGNQVGVALNGGWRELSIPNVSLVNLNSKSSTNLAEFVLERNLLLVLFLVRHVPFDLFDVGFTNGKDSASFVGPPLRGFVFSLIRYPGLRECSLWLTFAPPWADIGPPLWGLGASVAKSIDFAEPISQPKHSS